MQFSALFSYILWDIELKFCIWLCYTVILIKFNQIVHLCRFLWELCHCWNLEYWKYTVFRTFLLHALTYWAEILHMTLFYCTTDEVWVSSICINFCWSYAPFGTKNTEKTQFSALLSYTLWHIELKFYIWLLFYCTPDQVRVLSIRINFCRSNAPFGTWNTRNTQFSALFPYMHGHIELKFFIWLCLMYYNSSSSVITLYPSGSPSSHPFSALSSCMHWQI